MTGSNMLLISNEKYFQISYSSSRFSYVCVKKTKSTITDKPGSVCVLVHKIKHIVQLWKYQFLNNTTMVKSVPINILKCDISVIKLIL